MRIISGDESAFKLKNATNSPNLFSMCHLFAYTVNSSFGDKFP